MASKWVHKESEWCLDGSNRHDEYGTNFDLTDGIRDENGHSFTEWLDFECESDGPWEVIKISRNFISIQKNTWAVFRKQI